MLDRGQKSIFGLLVILMMDDREPMRSATRIFRARRRRLIGAWMGIIAFALPLLAPIAQGIPAFDDADSTNAPFYMVICKAMQDGSGDGKSNSPDKNDCPVCLSFAFGHSLVFSPLESALQAEIEPEAFPPPPDLTARAKHLTAWSFARAPPVPV